VTDKNVVHVNQWRKQMRDRLTAEIVEADRTPEQDPEADRLLAALSEALDKAPLADEEKVHALYTKLVEALAAIDSDSERHAYVDRLHKLLRDDIVTAAREAFQQIR